MHRYHPCPPLNDGVRRRGSSRPAVTSSRRIREENSGGSPLDVVPRFRREACGRIRPPFASRQLRPFPFHRPPCLRSIPRCRPCPNRHILCRLRCSGIHRPKIVHCDDSTGSRYRQLVKGSDDMRQDAVMEQARRRLPCPVGRRGRNGGYSFPHPLHIHIHQAALRSTDLSRAPLPS